MNINCRPALRGMIPLLWFLELLILAGTSGCGSESTTAPPSTMQVVLVRQLEGRGGLIALGANHMLAVLTARHLVVLNAIQGDTVFITSSPMQADMHTDRGLVFSSDARFLAASVNSALTVVDLPSGRVLIRNTYIHGAGLRSMGALAFTPDDRQLLIGGQMGHVFAMNLPAGEVSDSLPVSGGGTVGISILPDGGTAAIAGFDGDVRLWAWKEHAVWGTLDSCKGWCAAADASARFLLAGCRGNSIRVWDLRTLRLAGMIGSHPFMGLEFSASKLGDLMIAGSGPGSSHNPEGLTTSEILIFDLSTLQPIASWRAHTADGIYDTAACPDGSLFATCGYDGVVDLWSLKE